MIKFLFLGTISLIILCTLHVLQVYGSPQLDTLRSQAIKSNQYVIPVPDYQTYQNLILGERKKPILLFLTVGPDRADQCPYCGVFQKIIKEIARKAKNDDNIYFTQVEFSASTQLIAQQLNINQVPVVLLFKAGSGSTTPVRCDLGKEQIPDFIEENAGIRIDFSEQEMMKILASDPVFKQAKQQQQQEGEGDAEEGGSALPFSLSSLMRFIWQISFIILAAVLSIISLPYVTQVDRRTLLTFGCWLIFILCLGGSVYNMIHQSELFHYNPYTGKTMFLYPEMRGQFVLEGYVAVACMVIGGACFVACTQLVPLVQSAFMKRLVSMFLLSMFWLSFGTVFVFFSMKMAGYMHGSPVSSYVQLASTLFGGE